ncbi:AbiV family abortive infection protein [uncultured Herbaspirillum sp.]|uniref:AbiV family abortive infection protein n=1 Tax=uncultured Herbaspirillum sp. TaxID=160236 RepID=UPI00258ED973|nr:AbiV family abortive infection protein [uncultured Herbaspirillum sp.]
MNKSQISALPTLTKYKWKKLGAESLKNVLRLHRDAILLFRAKSFPSAYQLSVLSLEEFAKAKMIEHYFYSSITNEGFPSAEFEQEWLQLLYLHGKKQYLFAARDENDYSASFIAFLKSGQLERRKQKAVYVGLERDRRTINVRGRISTPKSISEKEAKRVISLVNAELTFGYNCLKHYEFYYGIEAMDDVLLSQEAAIIFDWPFKTRTRFFRHTPALLKPGK